MDKSEAKKIGIRVGSCFNVYFKNAYRVNAGRHWKQRGPEDAAQVAHNSISANCDVIRATDSKAGTFAWNIEVAATEPKFVEPLFHISLLDNELRQLFGGKILPVTQSVDLRNSRLCLSYKGSNTPQYYHFNFQLKGLDIKLKK